MIVAGDTEDGGGLLTINSKAGQAPAAQRLAITTQPPLWLPESGWKGCSMSCLATAAGGP